MDQERFVVIDNKKGVVIPLSADKKAEISETAALEEKVNRMHLLIKALIKQTVKNTIEEYSLPLTEEIKEFEKNEICRWNDLIKREDEKWDKIRLQEKERWDAFEKRDKEYKNERKQEEEKRWSEMEKHFLTIDRNIRAKQKNRRG